MNQLCKVCGEPAAGFHFGAFTCEGCKSFFGRTYNNISAISGCKNNGDCVINKKNRTACKACRLRKCLLVGMSKSGSRYGRRSNWFKIHCLLQEQQQTQQHQSQQQQEYHHQQQQYQQQHQQQHQQQQQLDKKIQKESEKYLEKQNRKLVQYENEKQFKHQNEAHKLKNSPSMPSTPFEYLRQETSAREFHSPEKLLPPKENKEFKTVNFPYPDRITLFNPFISLQNGGSCLIVNNNEEKRSFDSSNMRTTSSPSDSGASSAPDHEYISTSVSNINNNNNNGCIKSNSLNKSPIEKDLEKCTLSYDLGRKCSSEPIRDFPPLPNVLNQLPKAPQDFHNILPSPILIPAPSSSTFYPGYLYNASCLDTQDEPIDLSVKSIRRKCKTTSPTIKEVIDTKSEGISSTTTTPLDLTAMRSQPLQG